MRSIEVDAGLIVNDSEFDHVIDIGEDIEPTSETAPIIDLDGVLDGWLL